MPFPFRLLTVCALGALVAGCGAPSASAQIEPLTISAANPASLRDGILAAAQSGAKKVVIAPGVYQLPVYDGPANLEFTELKNLEIDATGTTWLVPDSTKGGVRFTRCQNVTLRGATIRNARIPFGQGTITAIAPDRKSFEITVDAGYPANMDDGKFFAVNGVLVSVRPRHAPP